MPVSSNVRHHIQRLGRLGKPRLLRENDGSNLPQNKLLRILAMFLLPTDWLSFLWGAAIGAVAAFATGFFKKAGEKAFDKFERWRHPPTPEPTQVDGRFQPTRFNPGRCAWIRETQVYDYEAKGYTYYPNPKTNGHCFRITGDGNRLLKEFLMVEPGIAEEK